MTKKILSVLLAVCLIVGALPLSASAATSGSCGDNATWNLDKTTGVLTINGTGAMRDFISPFYAISGTNRDIPWRSETKSIKTVYIGEGITRIGEYVFAGCGNLASITIPGSVTSIGEFAFESCAFTSFTIPKNVTSLGRGVFERCSALTAFSVESENTAFSSSDGILYNKAKTTLVQFPEGKSTTFTVPQNVSNIGDRAFANNYSLTSVTISSDVTNIGKAAFTDCRALASVIISNTVTSIGGYAFSSCSNLTSITIPDSVTSIGEYAFLDCPFTFFTIPKNVVSIGFGALRGCSALTGISVESQNTAFSASDGILYNKSKTNLIQCPAGKKGNLTIPNGVTKIEKSAFENCIGLTSVALPESVVSIGESAFQGCFEVFSGGLTSINIPSNVTRIEDYTFFKCAALTSITIPNGVTSIGKCAFLWCKITSVTIPDSVTFIGESAFEEGTTIYGNKGGYAETYAKENNFKFSAIKTPSNPTSIDTAIAYASTQSVNVDGKVVEFQMYALKDASGNDTNYVKLRDVAAALDGTAVQFNVGWDGNVIIESGKRYTSRNGQENKTPYSGNQPFTATVAVIKTGLMTNNLAAFIIADSNGNGSTYCKLRDIGRLLNFKVDWSTERGVYIETTKTHDGRGYRDISKGVGEDNPYYVPGLGIMPIGY